MAEARVACGESGIAGGAALNAVMASPRVSQDLDVFHDSAEAVARSALSFEGSTPDPGALSRRWKETLEEARRIVGLLPPDQAGRCVIDRQMELLRLSPADLPAALAADSVRFHEGRLFGAWPEVR